MLMASWWYSIASSRRSVDCSTSADHGLAEIRNSSRRASARSASHRPWESVNRRLRSFVEKAVEGNRGKELRHQFDARRVVRILERRAWCLVECAKTAAAFVDVTQVVSQGCGRDVEEGGQARQTVR